MLESVRALYKSDLHVHVNNNIARGTTDPVGSRFVASPTRRPIYRAVFIPLVYRGYVAYNNRGKSSDRRYYFIIPDDDDNDGSVKPYTSPIYYNNNIRCKWVYNINSSSCVPTYIYI